MSLADYEKALTNCKPDECDSTFQKIADRYEDDLLEFDEYPEDYFHFFLKLLCEERFFEKPGLWNFLLVLSTESHKLSMEHYNKIADCIVDNYLKYNDADLCLSVCDFIARNYESKFAERLLLGLKDIEKQKIKAGFADDGLRILQNEIERSKARP